MSITAQENTNAVFVPNQGQWDAPFDYRLKMNFGALFFEPQSYTLLFCDPELTDRHQHGNHHKHAHKNKSLDEKWLHAIKVNFSQSNALAFISGKNPYNHYHNYFLGKESSQWKSHIPVYKNLSYSEIYSGISIDFFEKNDNLKYNFTLAPYADVSQIQMKYEGATSLQLKNKKLHIGTRFGEIIESIPEAFQIINGKKIQVKCNYVKNLNTIGFSLEKYNPHYPLIIDPELIFSSFSGSTADNWGFTATYDEDGNLYGGGAVFNDGGKYPTTVGAFQDTASGKPQGSGFYGDTDYGISKFSPQGNQLLYSTYMGGNQPDLPHSLFVDQGNLYILGSTGSSNFPTTSQALDTSFTASGIIKSEFFEFPNGSDIVISKLNTDGTNLLASTYFGGSGNEGVNNKRNGSMGIYHNYGDDSRGEIVVNNGKVYLISNTSSADLSLINSHQSTLGGKQDALILSLSDNLENLLWGSYFGGAENDAGYSLKIDQNNKLFITGATMSTSFPFTGFHTAALGNIDGYIAQFDANTGTFINGTYVGGNNDDQSFLLEIDRHNNIYVFGQAKGDITQSPDIYSNNNSHQFLKKYNNSLTHEIWSTQIGSGQSKTDLVPTAFLVDDCFRIYLSGWNGSSNSFFNGGDTRGLPITTDAHQSTTDGSDFYFMVLERDAKSLLYASYFGGLAGEHVDGGTSRFDANGTIYQAVCAGCSNRSFPTTPGVISEDNGSSNCNLGVIKINFETAVFSEPFIDISNDVDTICDSLKVKFSNKSRNAQEFYWDFGNGLTSTEETPSTYYTTLGLYDIMLIAIDTNCNTSDTSYISIEHTQGEKPKASFEAHYASCDTDFKGSFTSTCNTCQQFLWDFGDGAHSNAANPLHYFPGNGTYIVTLEAIDTICGASASYSDTLTFEDTTTAPLVFINTSSCGNGAIEVLYHNTKNSFQYLWDFGDGNSEEGVTPNHRYTEPGKYTIKLSIVDTACNKSYEVSQTLKIDKIIGATYIPNSFTPNRNGINESFMISGDNCTEQSEIRIFNRWGEMVFYSTQPFSDFWDGTLNNKPVPEGVYSYFLNNGSENIKGIVTLIR